MNTLCFKPYFQRLHGYAPFPWQVRAANHLVQRTPMAVTVPTGMGKSAMVDAAIWAAASGGWRRIVFVVDRRIVVDAVHQRAERIKAKLLASTDPELQALSERVGDMQVVRLRGGVFGDDDWVLYPERLTVVLSTVDQIGSRLLFRGYGVSPKRWSMHAGFFGHDTLVVVDEAHLSTAFLQTLQTLQEQGAGISVVPMSATPPPGWAGQVIGLEAADLATEGVAQRLRTSKRAILMEGGTTEDELIRLASEQTQRLLAHPEHRRVLVVVNRVATARRCFERLRAQGLACTLITGRVRAVERDEELTHVVPLVSTERTRETSSAPYVVVATQTVEVGADFDFDALVSESAPLSALRQRFGRLDRLGLRGHAEAVILHRALKEDKDDPVYGPALARTWAWLQANADMGTVDFGIEALEALLSAHPAPLEPAPFAPSLLPTHVRLLAQTGVCAPTLDISAWLHGVQTRAPDVLMVWRDDLSEADTDAWPRALSLLPPMLREGLAMPATAVRRWLTRGRPGDGWHDAGSDTDDISALGPEPDRPVLLWRGIDDCHVIPAQALKPGDTIVLPTRYGGCDTWGWAPHVSTAVRDLADICQAERHRAGATMQRVVLRLAEGHWDSFGAATETLRTKVQALMQWQEAQATNAEEDLEDTIEAAREDLLDALRASGHPLIECMHEMQIEPHPAGVVVSGRGAHEGQDTVETGCVVALDVHLADVGRWGAHLAGNDPLAQTIEAAGKVHDIGKAEPRMQNLLHGHPLAAARGPLLAKSGMRRNDQRLAALAASGLPRGFRHEFASLDLCVIDDELTRYLVATHHGHGRPWLNPCEDPQAKGAKFARLDAHWPAVWARSVTSLGPWGLAWAECLLRAADARASKEEEEGDRHG
ncbi:MAG: type I-U CRISPR-associated helicase/endonuclease Cas3 [Leptothrix ochracea]|uniref:type I-G CRISPR-associated helicase/endonuclease Cas3g n=1 Tax=Leptothrix ochracea TaxID=735331 RepID=UPI0034E24F56